MAFASGVARGKAALGRKRFQTHTGAPSLDVSRPRREIRGDKKASSPLVRVLASSSSIPASAPGSSGPPFLPRSPLREGLLPKTNLKTRSLQAEASENGGAGWLQTYLKFSNIFANMFPVWTVMAAVLGLRNPSLFSWLTTQYFTLGLAILMFSMGITLTPSDFKRVMSKPGPVTINFLCCYVMMPLLGLLLGRVFNLSAPIVAGLVLVGSINGGQASNLCTYIARGDVALSVVMTTSTTLGTMFMTPLIAKVLLGTIVPVDAIGVAISALQVVLLPIFLGVALNSAAPKFCRKVEPLCPTVGVTSTVLLVGASVAGCSQAIRNAGLGLQLAVMLLHLVGGAAGYWLCRVCKFKEIVCRTTAIETAMKSSAFGVLLATLHFSDYLARVPSAVSVVWMAIMGSCMAVVWQFIPIKDEEE